MVLFLLGLAVGSFIGALTFRWPKGISISKGRSFCPHCRVKIVWYDNIPLLSYLLLGGRCRNCHKKISLRYPAVELATSLGFVGIGYLQGGFPLPYLLIVFSTLVALFVIDLEHQIIPDNLVFFLLVITYSLLVITSPPDFYVRVASGFVAALFLLAIHLITRGRGMGLGDVKFALFGGAFLGWPLTIPWFFISFLTGGFLGLILILLGKSSFGKKIAFGPFLVFGIVAAFIWGEDLLRLFLIK